MNGRGELLGTLLAVSEDGEPLGCEHSANFSDLREKERLIRALVADIGVTEDVARAAFAQAVKFARGAANEAQQSQRSEPDDTRPPHSLPVISITDRHMRDIVSDSFNVTVEARESGPPEIYQVGDALADLMSTDESVRPRLLGVTHLKGHLERLADYVSYDSKGQERRRRVPKDVVEDMLAFVDERVPKLTTVVRSPVCAPDGSILTEEGYHGQSGLYLALGGMRVPPVSASPSESEIRRACHLLLEEYLGDFPFVSPADRAHALSPGLTTLARHMIDGPTPLHLNESPLPGTGKGLLAETAASIVTGTPPAVMTEGHDEDEWRKRLTARLLTVPSVILIDNLRRRLDSSSLSAALTARLWEDRHLGLSRIVTVPVKAMWMATGNNPALSDEISRRVVRCRVDAEVESPWERDNFRHSNLRLWVEANRADLLWAFLTLIRAWVAAGRPHGSQVMGSFECWAATIGGILEVAGIPGFLGNREDVYAQAKSETGAWHSFVVIWWANYGDQQVGVDKLFDLAKGHHLLTELRSGHGDHGARVSMGMALSKMRDRQLGNHRIRFAGTAPDGRALMYRLEAPRTAHAETRKVSEHSGAPISAAPSLPNLTESQRNLGPDDDDQFLKCLTCGARVHIYDDAGDPWCERHGPESA